MDLRLSAKAQSLSLVSSTPLVSSVSTPRRIRLVRAQFLGSAHNLRPPGLGYRRGCKSLLGLRIRSPRFLVRASLDSQSVLVIVASVTVSALTVVYLNYANARKNLKEMSGQLIFALSQLIRSMMNQFSMERISRPIDLQKEICSKEIKDLMKQRKEISYDSENKETLKQLEETRVHEEALVTAAISSPGSSVAALSIPGSSFSGQSEVTRISFPPSMSAVSGALPLASAPETRDKQGNVFGSDLPTLTATTEISADSYLANSIIEGINEFQRRKSHVEESESSCCGTSGESTREGREMFYEAKQSATKSMGNLNGLNTVSPQASFHNNNTLTFPIGNSTFEGATLPSRDILHTTENFEEKPPFGHHKRSSFSKMEELEKRKVFYSDKEKRVLCQNGHRSLSPALPAKRKHANGRYNPSEQFSAYNQFLREGRLIDCIKMLEDIERKGLLDMDKVYHAGFYRVCKVQKAIKEAFRFTKFIPNPTLSTFNMLMSVCASSQDSEGAFQVMQLVQEAGLKADCKLYTTLISTCAKSGKVDEMFKVFHEMVNAQVEPNVHTYGALIDGCAKAGQVAKAFGAYGIMRSKNVKPDRVIFNALITACGESGAVDRAFDVLAEMRAEAKPIDPDHVTIGALMKACEKGGQVDRAREVYNMIQEYNIKGTPEVYTIAVNSCSQTGDWDFALRVYNDMTTKGVVPDEMFFSALIDVAGHAGKIDTAFDILKEAKTRGIQVGVVSYSSLMGACSNAKSWKKALDFYEDTKNLNLRPTVPMMNALITALCDANQLQKAVEILFEMKRVGLCPNTITYSILLVASEKKDDVDIGLMLFSQAKKDRVAPNLVMCRCLNAMCLRRYEKACACGEPVLSFNSVQLQIDNKWTSSALMVYRETIVAGVVPTIEELSLVLGCLKLPYDVSLRSRLIENLGVSTDASNGSKLFSLIDGFGEYDPRALSLLEEAASLGIVPCVSLKESPIVVDVRKLPIYTAKVYFLTVLRGLKHRVAAGARLPNISILLPIEKRQIQTRAGKKTIGIAGRVSQAMAALLRRLGISYLGNESYGKIRINGVVVKKWFQLKLDFSFGQKPTEFNPPSLSRLGRGISHQQRDIRTGNLSLD